MSEEQRSAAVSKAETMRIGLLLAEIREEQGLTQTVLAERLGVRQPNISQIEAGEEIQLSTLRRLIGAMGGRIAIKLPNREVVLETLEVGK
ncbi:MAG: helix-turn-helix transcriptional regulator [Pirellulales bacterium]|nr:helix-turn-helix transcriptional regulator [Pirellulales bacterium]